MIYINDKGEYAKIIEHNPYTGMVVVVINDKSQTMYYKDFIKEFKGIGNDKR